CAVGQKLTTVHALRGLGALIVLVQHTLLTAGKLGQGKALLPALGPFAVAVADLFFVISGFVLVGVAHRACGQRWGAARFLYQRAARVYPLYWVYSALLLGFLLVWPEGQAFLERKQANLVTSFLLLPSERLPLLPVAWTLVHEVYFYGVLAVACLAGGRFFTGVLVAWGLAVAGCQLLPPGLLPADNALMRVLVSPFGIEFLLGCLAGRVFGAGV